MDNLEHQKAVAKIKRYDDLTYEHCMRVGKAASMLGKALGMTNPECEKLRRAGELHDIGKTKIPKTILNKNGRLTEDERQVMNEHVTRGVEQLKKYGLTSTEYLDAAGDHHAWHSNPEKGYRAGTGPQSETAQIMAIVDVYDALANKRSYKEAKSRDEVLEIMDENAEKGQFNQDFYECFVDEVMPVLEQERERAEREKQAKEILNKIPLKKVVLNESLAPRQQTAGYSLSM